jgi:hypothetical protein
MWFTINDTSSAYMWYAGTKLISTLDGNSQFTVQVLHVAGSDASIQIDGKDGLGSTYIYRSGNNTVFTDSTSSTGVFLTASPSDITVGRNVLVSGTLLGSNATFTTASISTLNGDIYVTGNVVAANVWKPWITSWGSLSFSANTPLQVTAASSIANLDNGTYVVEFKWDTASSNYWATVLSGTIGLYADLMNNSMSNAVLSLQGTYYHATAAMPTFYIRSDATNITTGYPQLFVTFPVTVIIYNAILTMKRIA